MYGSEITTDVTQWQGVDDEPVNGSDNLVKSGGVAEAFNNPSKGFVYDAIVKGGKKPVTSSAVYEKAAKIYDDDDNILSIADNNGNVSLKSTLEWKLMELVLLKQVHLILKIQFQKKTQL
jgi:hypothetical protein